MENIFHFLIYERILIVFPLVVSKNKLDSLEIKAWEQESETWSLQ